MPTTADGFPYPDASDPLGNVAARIQELAEHLDSVYEPWTQWNPPLVGTGGPGVQEIVLGAGGELVGFYTRWLDTVHFRVSLKLGAGGNIIGDMTIYLPTHLRGGELLLGGNQKDVGLANARDASSGLQYVGTARYSGSTVGPDELPGGIIPNFDGLAWGEAAPFNWTDNDYLTLVGSYRTTGPFP
jgi:hypothetical protein